MLRLLVLMLIFKCGNCHAEVDYGFASDDDIYQYHFEYSYNACLRIYLKSIFYESSHLDEVTNGAAPKVIGFAEGWRAALKFVKDSKKSLGAQRAKEAIFDRLYSDKIKFYYTIQIDVFSKNLTNPKMVSEVFDPKIVLSYLTNSGELLVGVFSSMKTALEMHKSLKEVYPSYISEQSYIRGIRRSSLRKCLGIDE